MSALKLYTKRPRKRIGPEACLQMAVVQYLMLQAPKGTIYFHPANEGKRSIPEGAHLKRLGMLPGVADLVIIMPGKTPCFLELKARDKEQSEDQIAFEELCDRNGSRYGLADNIDDALNILRAWNVIPALRSIAGRQAA